MAGAEQLSEAVLESGMSPFLNRIRLVLTGAFDLDRDVVRTHHDLHAQMTGRKERLSFLIKFINDNSALNKVPSLHCRRGSP